jgi:hypothetical protein
MDEEIFVEPLKLGRANPAGERGGVDDSWVLICNEGTKDSGGAGSVKFI